MPRRRTASRGIVYDGVGSVRFVAGNDEACDGTVWRGKTLDGSVP